MGPLSAPRPPSQCGPPSSPSSSSPSCTLWCLHLSLTWALCWEIQSPLYSTLHWGGTVRGGLGGTTSMVASALVHSMWVGKDDLLRMTSIIGSSSTVIRDWEETSSDARRLLYSIEMDEICTLLYSTNY